MTPKKSVWAKAHASVGAAQDAIRKLPPNTYGLRRDNLALIEGMRELVTVMQDLLANMYDRGSQPGLSHGKNLERQEIKQEEEDHQQEGEDHQQQEKNQQQQEEQDEGEIPVPVLQHRQTKVRSMTASFVHIHPDGPSFLVHGTLSALNGFELMLQSELARKRVGLRKR